MGVLLTTGRLVLGILLVISLSLFITAYSASLHYNESNLKELVATIINQQMPQDKLIQQQVSYLEQCQSKDQIRISVDGLSSKLNTITLNCEDIRASSAYDLPTLYGNALFNEVYYSDQKNINLFSAILTGNQEDIIFSAISQSNTNYVNNWKYIFSILTLILLALFVIINLPPIKALIKTGTLLGIIAIISLLSLKFLITPLISSINQGINLPLINDIFSTMYGGYIILLVLGAIILITGIILKIVFKVSKVAESQSQKKTIKKQGKVLDQHNKIIRKQQDIINEQQRIMEMKSKQKKAKQKAKTNIKKK